MPLKDFLHELGQLGPVGCLAFLSEHFFKPAFRSGAEEPAGFRTAALHTSKEIRSETLVPCNSNLSLSFVACHALMGPGPGDDL